MKELSIEDKAKRYDEALGKARRYYDEYKTRDNILYVEDMEDMFPELKESEDEKIRKALIEAIRHNYVLTGSINHIPTKDILAWLEKHEEDTYDYKRVDLDKFDERIQEFSDMLEDKPKPYWDGWYEAMEWIRTHGNPFKKQGEQKPVDKIEPKFKVGDWVVRNGETLQISGIDTVLDGTFHYWFTKGTWLSSKKMKNAMLWTIQDAKDGDVLADDRVILLFRSIGNRNWKDAISYYAILETNLNNRFSISDDEEYWGKVEDCELKPASEEQRDLLFQKMKEAGYEWDADKKELKKIEQKPADKKGMNLVEEEMTPFQKEVFCIIDTTIEEEQGLKQVCDKLFALASNEIKQKFSLSEEDYNEIETIACHLDNIDNEGMAEVLRNIRDKYYGIIPQNTWKPSDEQIQALEAIIGCVHDNASWEIGTEWFGVLFKLKEQLKKLKG